jgi:nucleoside-diphosphate kinase
MEKTFVLIKPDGVERALIGTIITRLEQRGLKLAGMKFLQVNTDLAEQHYAVHKGKSFYTGLIAYITSAPVVAMVWEGPDSVAAVRQTMGATNPTEAAAGSIRADFALTIGRNLTHASDSTENAAKEISLWFSPQEILSWQRDTDRWTFTNN